MKKNSDKIFVISHDNERIAKLKDDIIIIDERLNPSVYSSKFADSESVSGILLELSQSSNFIVFANAAELETKLFQRKLLLILSSS